jgi:hypothetical protein
MPLKLIVDPPRFELEDQGVFFLINRPVRSVGPAECLPNRIQRATDDVIDRAGPDDGICRLDHGPCIGCGIGQKRLAILSAIEQP